LVPLCLEHAGAVPLTVDIAVSDIRSGEDFLKSLIPHTSRIGRLRLVGYPSVETVETDFPSLFDSPMLNLTSLELGQTEEPTDLFPSSEAPVPPVFQNVSKLKSLHLTQTPLYPSLSSIASLRELRLTGYTNSFRFEAFIGFLASNPSLETVALDIKFAEGLALLPPARTVSLTRLQHLSITCAKPIDAKGLLSCIKFPRGIHLEVVYLGSDQPTLLTSSLPLILAPIHEALAPITIVKVQNSPRELQVLGDDGFFSFRSFHSTRWWPEIHLFSTASVREFHVNNRPWFLAPEFLVSLLPRVPALETLVITNTEFWATGIFDWLAEQPLLCPSLKTIAFFNCTLTPQVTRELEGALAKRKGSAATWLYRVVIVSSTGVLPGHSLVQRLRQQVSCVDVRVADELPDLS
jgi:hypothetical protein